MEVLDLLDGSELTDSIIRSALEWDVINGIARRNWATNENAIKVAKEWNKENEGISHITIPEIADEELLEEIVNKYL